MRHLLLSATVALMLAATSAKTAYEGYKVYNCLDVKENKLEMLMDYCEKNGHDVWLASNAEERAEIMVAPKDQTEFLTYLDQNKIRHEDLIKNVQETVRYENHFSKLRYEDETANISFNKYHSFSKINDFLAQMASTYPQVASVVTIGQSTEGRDLKVLKISRGGNNPVIWIDAGIHAREWIAPAMALYVINQLLEVPANSALLDGVDWHILPVVNPDGYQWSFTNDRFWRKTRSKTWCGQTEKSGVDANRNWDFKWEENVRDHACSNIFPGETPFSEPETIAMRNYLLGIKERLKMYISFHSYGPYIFTPWAWTSDQPSDWKTLYELASAANAAVIAVGGESAEIGSPSELLYKAAGSSYDWARAVLGVNLSYTIELPGGGKMGFDLPSNKILEIVSQYIQVVRVFGEHIKTHFRQD